MAKTQSILKWLKSEALRLPVGSSSSPSYRKELGAVLVEIVILLPLFFAGILFVIWYILLLNNQLSLRTGTSNAVRLAIGRGQLYGNTKGSSFQVSPIQPLDQWINSSGCDSDSGPSNTVLRDLFVHGPNAQFKNYNIWARSEFNKAFCQLPSEYIYSVVYANALHLISIGKGARFPCEPTPDSEAESPEDSYSCLKCMPINPFGSLANQGSAALPKGQITLECRYNAPNSLINPVLALLSLVAGMPEFPKYSLITSRFTVMSPQ